MNAFARKPNFGGAPSVRRSLIAKVQIARKDLKLSEDDYRAVLMDVTGKSSAAMLDENQLIAVIERFKARGWQAAQPKGRSTIRATPADHRTAMKARALWISLYHLNAIDDGSEAALEAFARRQLNVARLQWADQALMYKLIEAAKAIGQRHGWEQSTAGLRPDTALAVLKRRLVERILDKLIEGGHVPGQWDISIAAYRLSGIEMPRYGCSDLQLLDRVAKALGDKLRALESVR